MSAVSVLRSCSRAVAQALGDFEVRMASEEWANFQRPWCRIGWATPGTSASHGAAHRDHRRTVSITAWPVEGLNGTSSLLEAERVGALVTDCFSKGLDASVVSSHNPRRAHPRRLPVYSYEGVPLHSPGPVEPVGFARVVESPSVEVFPDPASNTSYVVTATVVLGWSEGIMRPDPGPLVQRVIGGHVP